jgi:glutaredoxin
MTAIILYTTAGCHLCEEAEQLLAVLQQESPRELQRVDISSDPQLVDRYGIRIPVVFRTQDRRELGWPFDLLRLREFLNQA